MINIIVCSLNFCCSCIVYRILVINMNRLQPETPASCESHSSSAQTSCSSYSAPEANREHDEHMVSCNGYHSCMRGVVVVLCESVC